jgi:hypothetical protein
LLGRAGQPAGTVQFAPHGGRRESEVEQRIMDAGIFGALKNLFGVVQPSLLDGASRFAQHQLNVGAR